MAKGSRRRLVVLRPTTEEILVPPTKTEPADTKTRCVHGHPFDEANTYIVPKTGKRPYRKTPTGRLGPQPNARPRELARCAYRLRS